jgi:hypothetical protein
MPSYYIVLEQEIPNFDAYVNGNMLSRENDALERLAKKIGATPLLSFFGTSPEELASLVGDEAKSVGGLRAKAIEEQWFSAEDGLNSVRKLISHFQFVEVQKADQVLSNLKEFERVLEEASQRGIRWHLAIDY